MSVLNDKLARLRSLLWPYESRSIDEPLGVEVVVSCGNRHGESVFWSSEHGLLYWTDVLGEKIWTYDPVGQHSRAFDAPGSVCCFATRKDRPWNMLVAAFPDCFAFLNLITGERTFIASIETDLSNTRLNDGRTDRRGSFIAGGMDMGGQGPKSSIYRLDPNLRVTRLFGDVGCANGTCFSPNGQTMWFADSTKNQIECFDYNEFAGTVSNRRLIGKRDAPGLPDGSCVDVDGYVWNAVWDGQRLERWSPEGRIVSTIDLPVKKPTSCAFGGPNLDTLFITSSQHGERPGDVSKNGGPGSLFSIKPGVIGVADVAFAG